MFRYRALMALMVASLLSLAAGEAAAAGLTDLADPTAHLSVPPSVTGGRGAGGANDGGGSVFTPVPDMDRGPPAPRASETLGATPSCVESDPSALPCRHRETGGRR